jgi:hypothetical protein
MPQGHKSGRKTIMTRLMPLGHNPSTRLMPQGHKVRVYGISNFTRKSWFRLQELPIS